MEKLWYTLSSNVLENMINFATKDQDEICPTFLLEIETITPSINRYVLNLIDGTNKSIFCVTASEYSNTFCKYHAITGNLIRILRYWLFQIESDDSENEYQHKYVVMILDAEIVTLAPTKSIKTIKRVTSKTPRIRGIVDSCSSVSGTDDDCLVLRFRLRDDTGSIGCAVWGSLCLPLEPVLNEGVKLELSHAMVTEATPEYRIYDDDVELKLTEFSILKIFNPYDLSLLYAYPSRIINEIMPSDVTSITEVNLESSFDSDFELTSDLPNEIEHQLCSNGNLPLPIASLTIYGMSKFWLRGTVESYYGIHINQVNQKFIIFDLRDYSALITCVVMEPVCLSMNGVIKDGVVLEVMNAYVKPGRKKKLNVENRKFEISIGKYASVNAFAPDGSLIYEYKKCKATVIHQEKNISQIVSSKSSSEVNSEPSNKKLSNKIISLNNESNCSSWIRGVVQRYYGISTTRLSRVASCFDLCDNTASIYCRAWEPLSIELNEKIKEGMIIEFRNYKISPDKRRNANHKYQIFLNCFSSVKVYTADNSLIYEYTLKS